MKGTQNQLERFRSIAKRLVDEHSAEVFIRSAMGAERENSLTDDVYYSHLDILGKELNEQAQHFIGCYKTVGEDVKSEIWNTCRKYIDQFIRRNQPSYY
jgi:hypothetical protein